VGEEMTIDLIRLHIIDSKADTSTWETNYIAIDDEGKFNLDHEIEPFDETIEILTRLRDDGCIQITSENEEVVKTYVLSEMDADGIVEMLIDEFDIDAYIICNIEDITVDMCEPDEPELK
jgi:hypothetical protein